ncbi:unnamed protein product [Bursaphelenchus okinawaensis]|uniref:Legumain n=1 Tax=Bursaphelenchus okinawaensis TaxID=465554 RepID=A0A811LMY1_9BILA|nr:unnamed protein product [Bursaphelenchus okinawaensis]CAG9128305.1 unnamed protein product [Bursaphelenchus okinawaensis]
MRRLAILAALFAVAQPNAIRQFLDNKEDGGELYAVLVAGAPDYTNLFSETNVCLVYHILRKHGVKDENIITFAEDLAVNDSRSPWQGELRPRPDDPDVYQGCKITYREKDLSIENFERVLLGNDTTGGPILQSTSKDRVFMYHTSHGDDHIVQFGLDYLYTSKLQEILSSMQKNNKYKELFYQVEACYSGSMFDDWLTPEYNILAFTAASPTEEAIAICYAYNDDWFLISGKYSCQMQHFMEQKDLTIHALNEQYEYIKNNYDDSTVSRYGNLEIGREKTSAYEGAVVKDYGIIEPSSCEDYSISMQKADLYSLKHGLTVAEANKDVNRVTELNKELEKLYNLRHNTNRKIKDFVKKVTAQDGFELKNRGRARLSELKCYEQLGRTFHKHCYPEQQMRIGKINYDKLYDLCHSNGTTEELVRQLTMHCQN